MINFENHNKKNGSTMVIVLIMAAILFILGMSLLTIIGIEASSMTSNENTAKVLYTADSGMMWMKSEMFSRRFYNITPNNSSPAYFYNSTAVPGVDSFPGDPGYNLPSALANALEVATDSSTILSFKVLRDTHYRATDGTIYQMQTLTNSTLDLNNPYSGCYFLYQDNDSNDPYIHYYVTSFPPGDTDHSVDSAYNIRPAYALFFPDGIRDSSGAVITAPPMTAGGTVDRWRRWPHNDSENPSDTTNPSNPNTFDNRESAAVFSAAENRCPVAGCTHNNDRDANGNTLVHFHYIYYFTIVAFKYNPGQTYGDAFTKKIIKVQIASVDRLDVCEVSYKNMGSDGSGYVQYLVDRRNILYRWYEQNR